MIINGIDIYTERHGEGVPLIVLHGGPGLGHDYFKPALLSASRFAEVIFYDQRCSGKSQNLSMEDCCELSLHIEDLEALTKSLGLNGFVLLGHSFGSYLALAYAVRHAKNISKLILVSPVLPYAEPPEQIHRWFSFFSGDLRRKLDKINMSNDPPPKKTLDRFDLALPLYFHQEKALAEFRSRRFSFSGELIEECSKKSMLTDLRDDIVRLTMPVTMIVGTEDKRTPPQYSAELSGFIENSMIIEMPETGHFPFLEHPEKFMEILKMEVMESNPE